MILLTAKLGSWYIAVKIRSSLTKLLDIGHL
eukprot:SAG31_NODE_42637_length_270_cov_1.204678_1_plen_30_part_01